MARAQRSNSVDQLFSGFVNLFKAEYAPNSVTVDERRYLEMSVKPDEILKAVEWIEAHYKGQAMIWTLLPNLGDTLHGVQGDCTVRDISVYLERPPVLEDILTFCSSSRSWVEGEAGNISILLYTFDIKTVRWASLLSCSYLLFFRRAMSSLAAITFLYKQRTLYHKRDKKRTPDMTRQLMSYLLYMERMVKNELPTKMEPITIREVVMRGIPRCNVAPAGCIPMLAIRDSRTGAILFQTSADRHFSPEDGVARWNVPNKVCFGDIIITIHHCPSVDPDASFADMRQKGELLLGFGLHSALLDMHNSAPKKSATSYMHPFACCLQYPEDCKCVCLDRTSLGIPHRDDRFRLDFHIELVLSAKTNPEDAAPFTNSVLNLQQYAQALPALYARADESAAVGARGLLKVTPNPKDLLREFRGTSRAVESFGSEDDACRENVNSVGVRFSFPPHKNPFTGNVEASLLAEAGTDASLMELGDGRWGWPVQGFCMVLSLLVVLEPLESDVNANSTGNWKKCRIRVPIEKITKIEVAEGRLVMEWDTGDARGKESVVIDDQGLAKHVDEIGALIKNNMLNNVQAVRAMAVGDMDEPITPHSGTSDDDDDDEDAGLELSHESKVIDLSLAKKLRKEFPYRFRSYSKWDLLFSTELHGSSVGTFFNRTGWRSPTLLLVMDETRAVFGAFCSAPWEMHYSYFGTGECFVWKAEEDRLQIYRWGMQNDMFQLAHKKDGIAVGGGKSHAIWFDAAFENGVSGPCETFNSPALSGNGNEQPWRVLHMEA